MNKKSLNTSIPSLHFQSRSGMLNHTGGTYSHSGMMDYPRIPLSELNLGKKFPDSMEFQSWKVKTNCVHDLWVFPCNRRLWSSTRTLSDLFPISLQNDDVSAKLRFSNFWKKEQYCSQTCRLMVTTLSLSSLVGSHQFPGCDFDFFENANSMLSHSPTLSPWRRTPACWAWWPTIPGTPVVKGQFCSVDASCHILGYKELVLFFSTFVELTIHFSP